MVYLFQFSVSEWILLAAYVAIAVFAILKKRNVYTVIPFAVAALVRVVDAVRWPIFLANVGWDIVRVDVVEVCVVLLYPLAYICLLLLAMVQFTPLLQGLKEKVSGLWYIPAALSLGEGVRTFLNCLLSAHFHGLELILMLRALVTAIILFFIAAWVAFPNGFPRKEKRVSESTVVAQDGFCSMTKHVLLLLFTCGVWMYIWIFKATNFTNGAKGEGQRNPVASMLLCMFVPFYSIVWTYKTARRVDMMAAEKGIQSDLGTLCLIMAIVFGILPPILLQDKINAIATAKTNEIQ